MLEAVTRGLAGWFRAKVIAGGVLVLALLGPSCAAEKTDSPEEQVDGPDHANAASALVEDAAVAKASVPAAPGGPGSLESLPWEQRVDLERSLAEKDPRYASRTVAGQVELESPAAGRAKIGARGLTLELGAAGEAGSALSVEVTAIGRAGSLATAQRSAPSVRGAEVRLERGAGATEWWRALPSGLEHGVTLASRPAGVGPVVVEVSVPEDVRVTKLSESAVALARGAVRVARYEHLLVRDARGSALPAHFEADGHVVRVVVDDAGAAYPIEIDPLLVAEEAELRVPASAVGGSTGHSVAISGDGTRALLGAPTATVGFVQQGAALMFTWNGSSWVHETTLVASGGAADDRFGYSVALSSDGSRAVVGGIQDDTPGGTNAGSARVFVRSGSTWTEEATLLASGGAANDSFGYSVALSADGSRALVGAPGDDTAGGTDAGSARVFIRSGSTWTEEATLLASAGAPGDRLGFAVALSADASRAVVGARSDDTPGGTEAGSARVFIRSGSTWTEEATLLASGGAASDNFGYAVALSADGSRAVVGANLDDTPGGADAGSARVFVRSGSTWTEEATLLAMGGAANDQLGFAVALSSDGSRAIVGSILDDIPSVTNPGSARVFVRSGSTWTEEATLLASDGAPGDNFGNSVALSADGSRVVVGAPRDETVDAMDGGTARAFVRSGSIWIEESTLFASSSAPNDNLGHDVALSADGSRAVVSAYRDDTPGGTDAGSARVFVRSGSTWTEEATLLASGGAAGDQFGFAVALSADGSRAVVGAYLDDTAGGTNAGSARVFVRLGSTWTEEAALLPSGGAAGDGFGASVGLSADGSRAVVGAPLDDTGYSGAGSAHVFTLVEPPLTCLDGSDAARVSASMVSAATPRVGAEVPAIAKRAASPPAGRWTAPAPRWSQLWRRM